MAHDPIFGIGPHVLYKGGVEVAAVLHREKSGDERETESAVELVYGITSDWAAGVELPYTQKKDAGIKASGEGDVAAFTKYRFWRKDMLGAQESAGLLCRVKFSTGDGTSMPPTGTGTTDTTLGLAYGYEGRKWYRWAGVRYRRNGKNDAGLRRGDKILLDLVGGIRFRQTAYVEPDAVWMLELNGEYGKRAELGSATLSNTGGSEWFIAPGLFWSQRNFAFKVGVQFPLASDLNGDQKETDYRAKLVLEWHL